MNKSDLVEEIARRTDVESDDVVTVIESFIDVVTRAVAQGDKVVLSGFGTFHRQARARRTARDIRADQPIAVPARNVPAFRPGKPFRTLVAKRRRAARPAAPAPAGRLRAGTARRSPQRRATGRART